MNSATKILGSLAIAGVIAAGSSAFTAGGLSMTASPTVSLGGSVTQTIEGALEVTNIAYNYTSPEGLVDQATITFGSTAAGRTVTGAPNGLNAAACTVVTTVATCDFTAVDLNTFGVTVADLP